MRALFRQASALGGQELPSLLQVALGKGASALLAFIAGALVAQALGPEGFGFFSIAVAITAVVTEATGVGLETSLVRAATEFSRTGRHPLVPQVYASVLVLKTAVTTALLALGLVVVEPVVGGALARPGYLAPIRFALVGAVGAALWRFVLAVLQAEARFLRFTVVQVVNNLYRLAAVGLLLGLSVLDLRTALTVHASAFFVGFAVGLPSILRRLAGGLPVSGRVWSTLLGFGGWVTVTTCMSITNYWMGVILLGFLGDPRAAGEYAAAFQLAIVFDLLVVSMNTVLLARVCRLSASEYRGYIRHVTTLTLSATALLTPLLAFTGPLFGAIYGARFADAVPVFRVLFFGFMLTLVIEPVALIFYARNEPQVLTRIEAVRFVAGLTASLVLIPRYGPVGAATAFLGMKCIGGGFVLGHLRARLRPRG